MMSLKEGKYKKQGINKSPSGKRPTLKEPSGTNTVPPSPVQPKYKTTRNDMDIEEARKKKKELESKIYNHISSFEKETGLSVQNVGLSHALRGSNISIVTKVQIDTSVD